MTVRELIEELLKWPQDDPVLIAAPEPRSEVDARAVGTIGYWAAYNRGYVVIG